MAAGAGVWIRPFRSDQHRVYYRLEPGATLHGSRGFKTYEEAERWADAMRTKITTRRRTVGDVLASYQVHLQERVARNELRAQSASAMQRDLERLMADAVDLPLGSLTPAKCSALYEQLANSGEAAVSTHQRMLDFARTFGAWLHKRGWSKLNPWAGVEKLGVKADHRSEVLRVDEARVLRETAFRMARAGDEGAVATLIVLMSSLRPSEVAQLLVRDVDDGGRLLWVNGRQLKNKNTRRAMDVLDGDLGDLLVAVATGRTATESLLKKHRHRQRVQEAVQRITAAAGIPAVDPRTLRRTFATLTARRGATLDATALAMGHGADAAARTARRHYIAPGAIESGASRRVLEVLDGGRRKRPR